MSNTTAHDRAHHQRSEEQSRADKTTRQLWDKNEKFGYFVRGYYIESDDSYLLQWRLPDEPPATGEKRFVNVDEFFHSFKYCWEEIERHCQRWGIPSDRSLPRKSICTGARRPKAAAPARMP